LVPRQSLRPNPLDLGRCWFSKSRTGAQAFLFHGLPGAPPSRRHSRQIPSGFCKKAVFAIFQPALPANREIILALNSFALRPKPKSRTMRHQASSDTLLISAVKQNPISLKYLQHLDSRFLASHRLSTWRASLMIGKTLGHDQITYGYQVIPGFACLCLVAAPVPGLLGSLIISAPGVEAAAAPAGGIPRTIRFAVNWFEGMTQRVPVK
jgi:hypothetical protein